MTKNIYDLHRAAFANVSAFVVQDARKEVVAKVAFKYPRDGAGRLWCYLHVIGLPMVRGYAGGYGYDKASAAFIDAARKQCSVNLESWQSLENHTAEFTFAKSIHDACAGRDGYDWNHNLREAGFEVVGAL